jgi:phospholipid/cholesterol/gamma-HCH transport system ATP-binding protein
MAQDELDSDIVISVRGLRNAFGDQVIHDNLDLDVRRGEILGIVGGSGTGKSVLMRSIIGLQRPADGSITVLGENLLDDDVAMKYAAAGAYCFRAGRCFQR